MRTSTSDERFDDADADPEMLNRSMAALLPLAPKSIVRQVASRYVAGESRTEALDTARFLNGIGARVTLALLGEHSPTREAAAAVTEHYLELLERIDEARVQATISVKPTHLGLDIDPHQCLESLGRLTEEAARRSNFVRIDMESRHTTQATIDFFGILRRDFENVGLVLQAYLHRTLDDIDDLPRGSNVRLCKGIYVEPEDVAWSDPESIRQNFVAAFERLVDGGFFVGLATHDDLVIAACERIMAERRLSRDRYEMQMLLGVRHALRDELLGRHPLRVYVPYGPDWYDYSLRRLRENPRIVGHVMRALLGRE